MNCFNHPDSSAVASCIDCGKGLCKECASLYSMPICNECNSVRVKNDKMNISKKYIPSIIGAIVGVGISILMSIDIKADIITSISIAIMYSFIFAGIPWGWSVINFITPKMFLFLSWFGWLIYFLIKIFLSIFVGLVAMPIGIIRLIIQGKIAKNKENNILVNIES